MNSYEALRSRAASIDFSERGRIRVSGEDRARLLHAMSTNEVNGLSVGRGLYAFFLTAQGRIIADAYVYNLGESLWLDTEPETSSKLFSHLDKYIIADDVVLEDEQEKWAAVGVEGPASFDLCKGWGVDVPAEDFAWSPRGNGFVVRVAAVGKSGLRFFMPVAEKADFVEEVQGLGIPQASAQDFDVVRLENGRPRFGQDISERYLVQETQQFTAVSFNKGCYLGQEIVERVRSRGQVHRLLTSIHIAGADVPEVGTKLRNGDKEAGEITSAEFSPALGETVAFAYLRSESSTKGTRLTIGNGTEVYVP